MPRVPRRRPFPTPRLSLVELIGMVTVFAAYNAVFAKVFERMRQPSAPELVTRRVLLITLAVNLVISAPLALALLVRWVGDFGRARNAHEGSPRPAPAQDDLVALTETVLLGVLAAAALVRLVLGPGGRGAEPSSIMAAAVGIPVLFVLLVGLAALFFHLILRQFSSESQRPD